MAKDNFMTETSMDWNLLIFPMLSLTHTHMLISRQKMENINFEESSVLESARKFKSESNLVKRQCERT